VKTYDIYGTGSMSAVELRDRVAPLLGVTFEERESLYWGIYHRAGPLAGEHYRILTNVHEDPEELPYMEFADTPVLLEVNEPERPDELRALLTSVPGLVLLRRRER
jgi:hypothetical protein